MDSKTAKNIKSKNTRIERILGKALWSIGMRYRKNDKTVFGKPDFVFKSRQIAIFCDSEFWHGYNYLVKGERFKTNAKFWEKKILRNIERDREVNQKLKKDNWIVLRFWGIEIQNNLDACIQKIHEAYTGEDSNEKKDL